MTTPSIPPSNRDQLVIKGLHVAVDGQEILKGVDLTIGRGEIHALMGPNGSGKSTLGYAIMGHPSYEITSGTIELVGADGTRHDLLAMAPDARARAGVFLAFQRPMSIPGVRLADFLRHAVTNVRNPDRREGQELMPMRDFRSELKTKMAELSIDPEFARRYVNDGFSGGEMKRAEILQLAMLRPRFAILDETDSGLDADAVRLASQSIARIGGVAGDAPTGDSCMGILIITHHEQLLEHNVPHRTHVMLGGKIVESGGPELAAELHKRGYERIRAAYPDAAAAEKAMEEAARAADSAAV
ncbi:MAG: Fe-S cluster assembly ATPase SufC [Planctomycetota bacterium]|nr:MAG: Fe-S cluster assembly ATPase SufC [Planctomycetota bacterium]